MTDNDALITILTWYVVKLENIKNQRLTLNVFSMAELHSLAWHLIVKPSK